MVNDDGEPDDMILIESEQAASRHDQVANDTMHSSQTCLVSVGHNMGTHMPPAFHVPKDSLSRFVQSVKQRLSPQPRTAVEPHSKQIQLRSSECALFVSHGPYGIVDLGASQTVIGTQQVPDLLSYLPMHVRSKVREVPCRTIFRFGNSSTVTCRRALMVPLSRWYVKICIVESKTPFLISNNVFRTLGAQIDTASDHVHFSKLDIRMPLSLSEKKLYLLDFCELIRMGNQREQVSPKEQGEYPIMVSDTKGFHGVCRSSENPHDQVDSSSVSSIPKTCNSKFSGSDSEVAVQSNVRDVTDSQHGHLQPRRPTSSSDQSEETGRVPEDVVRSARTDASVVRGIQSESDFPRSCGDRPQVCPVVHSQVWGQSESFASALPVLRESVCGTSRADAGKVTEGNSRTANDGSQGQGQDEEADRSGERRGLVGARIWETMERGARGELHHPSRTENAEGSHLQYGELAESDRPAVAESHTDDHAESAGSALLRDWPSGSESILNAFDTIGHQMVQEFPEDVMDPLYFTENFQKSHQRSNWIYEEMWNYYQNKYHLQDPAEVHQHWQKSKVHLLEVYCSSDSQLTRQGELMGMSAIRFGLKQGDLATIGGRLKLYDVLWVIRPRHIWMSPRCGPWSSWNRLNACKSRQLAAQIHEDRKSENVHLLLCEAMFRLQQWRGNTFHAHLEQPEGSEMLAQKELEFVVCQSFRVQCDMCTAGQLRHPNSFELLRKRTQIWTTSRIVWRALQQYQCPGNHPHDSIAGSCHPRGSSRTSVSKYSELYTALFSKRVCKAIWCSNMVLEQAFRSHDEFIGAADDTQAEMPDAKRRRLNGKLHPDQLFVRPTADESSSSSDSHETHEDPLGEIRRLLQLADQCAPRVGNAIIRDGPLFEGVQNLSGKASCSS